MIKQLTKALLPVATLAIILASTVAPILIDAMEKLQTAF